MEAFISSHYRSTRQAFRVLSSEVRCGRKDGLSPLTKCTAAMRILAYGVAADSIDEDLKIGASITIEYLKKFALCVVEVFQE